MASAASNLDPTAEPHVVEESSSAGISQEETAPPEPAAVEVEVEEATEGEGEEEEGECGFCLFMKGGGCKEAFVAWEECVEAAEKEGSDMVERCFQVTSNLKACMDAHADYYAPVLQAEQAVSDQAEAAVAAAAAAAGADENKGEGSASSPATEEKKEDAMAESTSTAVSSTAAEGTKKEEAVVEKVESLSLSN